MIIFLLKMKVDIWFLIKADSLKMYLKFTWTTLYEV